MKQLEDKTASLDGLPAWRAEVNKGAEDLKEHLEEKAGETKAAMVALETPAAEVRTKAEEAEAKVM